MDADRVTDAGAAATTTDSGCDGPCQTRDLGTYSQYSCGGSGDSRLYCVEQP